MTTTYIGRHRDDIMTAERMTYLIERAYQHITDGAPVDRVLIADIRDQVPGAHTTHRALFDAAMSDIGLRPNAHVRAEAHRAILTDRDHQAAVVLGGTARHHLLIR